jgi:F-type H+-transporting ATPase subunit b
MVMKRAYPVVAVLFVLGAAPAYASSLPQLDPTWHANQLLWLAVSFLALYAAVSRFIAPSIKAVLTARDTAISDAIREAERAKLEAESTRGSATSESQSARARAAEFMAQAQAENSREAAQAMAKLDHELTRRANQADKALDDVLLKATDGVQQAAQSLAQAITEKLVATTANDADAPKLKLAVKR